MLRSTVALALVAGATAFAPAAMGPGLSLRAQGAAQRAPARAGAFLTTLWPWLHARRTAG
eukprot:3068087-Rhodomonas_salina.2